MEPILFDEVAEAARAMVPTNLGELRYRAHRYGAKVWFGPPEPPRVHYEAQVVGAKQVPEAKLLALEIGFHAEYPKPAENDEVLERLLKTENKWRPLLGEEAVAGPFLGRAQNWRRVSETWADPDLSDPEVCLEIAGRLVDYIAALEPLLRKG